MDIQTLVEKSRAGDISAFMELLKQKQTSFYRIALAYTKNSFDAEDCISEAAIKGFENIKQLHTPNKFFAWFTSILINMFRKNYKQKSLPSYILKKLRRKILNFLTIHAAE